MTDPSPDVADDELVLGVDLGGTKIRAGLVDRAGLIRASVEMPTPADDPTELLEQVVSLPELLTSRAGEAAGRLVAVGIGAAGVPDPETGELESAPNLTGLDGVALSDEVEERLGLPVTVINDVNAGALGELHHGAGRNFSSFAYVAVGTGLGMGLVIDRHLVIGAHGAAGEIGYLPLGGDPLDPRLVESGPLESVVSGPALEREYAARTGLARSAREIFDDLGIDPHASATVDDLAHRLAVGIRAVSVITDPECFVLAGGVGSRPELASRVETWFERLGGTTPIRASEAGAWGPVLGAASAVRETPWTSRKVRQS